MSRRHRFALALLVAAVPLLGQQHPNVERGFQADKVYQFGGIDNVNLYNGNLTLTIPIGGEYSGNGTLRYRFALFYNSKAWDEKIDVYEDPVACGPGGSNPPECNKQYIKTEPSKSSNAGMGWLLSLGRLVGPSDPSGQATPYFTYEGPDGAQHTFWKDDVTAGSAVRHTIDGSFLRLVYNSTSTQYEVQFPDGIVQAFGSAGSNSYRLEQIRDPFGNHLDVTYESGAGGKWTLTEYDASGVQVRQHFVSFQDMSVVTPPPANFPPNYLFAVQEIDLAAFGTTGTPPVPARAKYTLDYTIDEIQYDHCGGDFRWEATPNPKIPRLHGILLPDGSEWTASYFSDYCAGIKQLVLPTKGKINWTYGNYSLDAYLCPVPLEDGGTGNYFSTVRGVASRTLENNGQLFEWNYTVQPAEEVMWSCSQSAATPKARQSTVTVLSPDGRKTEHYFSIWNEAPLGDNFFDRSEYGLPFTRGTGSGCAATFSSSEFCLSSREYDCSTGTCSSSPARSHYVRYEGDSRYSALGIEEYGYRREVARRTVFHDDADRNVDVVRSRYDGLGHFRQVVTFDSWSGLSRTETTEYNPGKEDVMVSAATWENTPPNNRPGWSSEQTAWLLSLFSATEASENETAEKSEFCFDSDNGLLKRKRMLAGSDRQSKDLLAVFDHTNGNLTKERYFGGEATPLDTGFDTCTTAVTDSDLGAYSLTHEYASGSRKTTQYAGVSFSSLDLTIDGNTGLPSASKDTSLLQTDYSYDKQGRLTSEKPPGQAWTQYVYDITATPPTVVIKQWPNGQAAAGTPLTERHLYFDGFGHPIQTRAKMPAGWSVTKNTYDAFGRTKTSSMPEYKSDGTYESAFSPSNQQSFDYDFLGRLKTVTAPDGKKTTVAYYGKRPGTQVTGQFTARTVKIATSTTAETDSTTIENSDGLGRLRSVIEPNGTITAYGYDAGGRLTSVTMDNQTPAELQSRTFHYDGRGVVTDETHPEIGADGNKTITYDRYDARGHVLRKLVGALTAGATASDFDLKYEYDGAERLVKLYQILDRQNDDQPSQLRVLKEFNYDLNDGSFTPVNHSMGKLDTSVRYNHPATLPNQAFAPPSGTFVVTETFRYQNDAGTLSSRETRVEHDSGTPPRTLMHATSQTYTYNDLGQTTSLGYPVCGDNAPCSMGAPLTALGSTYADGRLASIPGYGSAFTYHPTGMLSQLVHGQNGGVNVADTYSADSGMPRPATITFSGWDDCVPPAPVIITAGQVCPSSAGHTASVAEVSGASYLWEITNGNGTINSGATSKDMVYSAGPSGTVALKVTVSTPSCGIGSDTKIVTIGQPTAQIVSGNTTINPNQSTPIYVTLTGTPPWRLTWMPGSVVQDNISSSPASWTVSPQATTTYSLSAVSDASGCVGTPSSNSVTVTVATAPAAPTGFYSSKASNNSKDVILRWNVVSGATSYRIERAPQIGQWSTITPACQQIGNVVQCVDSFASMSVPSPKAYVYRVKAVANTLSSEASGMDYATVADVLFTDEPLPANAMLIRGRHVGELRAAIDEVRVAAGLPRKWSSYAALSGSILASHFYNAQNVNNLPNATDLRNVLDEAVLAIVGARIPYSPPQPASVGGIFAYQVEQIRTGVK
jgi:YD repeat-containing protein